MMYHGNNQEKTGVPAVALLLLLVALLTGSHDVRVAPPVGSYSRHWQFPEKVLRLAPGLPVGTVVATWPVPLPAEGAEGGRERFLVQDGNSGWHADWLTEPTSVQGLMLRVVPGGEEGASEPGVRGDGVLQMELVTTGTVMPGWLVSTGRPVQWRLRQPDGRHGKILMSGQVSYAGQLKVEMEKTS